MFAMQAMCPSGVMYAFGTWAEHIASLRVKRATSRRQTDTLPGNTLLVTHGGVIDAILCIENGKANKHVTFQTAHATIVCVP